VSSRREFITLLGGAAAAWPLAAHAQQTAMPVIGYLFAGSPEESTHLTAAFRKGLAETGYVEGKNVAIEYRWTHNQNDQLPALVADLIGHRVTVLVTPNLIGAALEAKAATSSIPIVFGGGFDPVQAGLVASLNRPGGNITGVSFMSVELGAKRLGLLHELLPRATRFAALVNPTNPNAQANIAQASAAASAIGAQFEILATRTNRDIDSAFATLVKNRTDALLVSPLADQFRAVGVYTGRIIKGEKPAEVPILRPTKFEFVINLQTAKTIGLDVPPSVLARADEVIE
jgi:putative ABC transport system substrate-binding protein